jgi:hypothetical protein
VKNNNIIIDGSDTQVFPFILTSGFWDVNKKMYQVVWTRETMDGEVNLQ